MAVARKVDVVLARSSAIMPEPRVQRAAAFLGELGFSVLVLGWDRHRRYPKKEAVEARVEVRRIYAPGGHGAGVKNLPALLLYNLALFYACARSRPRIVHAVDLDTAVPALLSKYLFGSRFLYDIADWYSASRFRFARRLRVLERLIDRLENWVARQADYVLFPDESRLDFLTFRPTRSAVIYNSPEEWRPGPSQIRAWAFYSPYVAYAGRLDYDRGIKQAMVAADVAGIRLLLAGPGPLASECARRARQTPFVEYLGAVEYSDALALQAASIGVLATYDPSLQINRLAAPYKLYEALMLGKPVIASRGTGPGRVVEEHGVGLAVTYGSIEELARAFSYLVQSPGEARKMGERAQRLYQGRYSWRRQREKLRHIYLELTGTAWKRRAGA